MQWLHGLLHLLNCLSLLHVHIIVKVKVVEALLRNYVVKVIAFELTFASPDPLVPRVLTV